MLLWKLRKEIVYRKWETCKYHRIRHKVRSDSKPSHVELHLDSMFTLFKDSKLTKETDILTKQNLLIFTYFRNTEATSWKRSGQKKNNLKPPLKHLLL
jgi:arginine deiminase